MFKASSTVVDAVAYRVERYDDCCEKLRVDARRRDSRGRDLSLSKYSLCRMCGMVTASAVVRVVRAVSGTESGRVKRRQRKVMFERTGDVELGLRLIPQLGEVMPDEAGEEVRAVYEETRICGSRSSTSSSALSPTTHPTSLSPGRG